MAVRSLTAAKFDEEGKFIQFQANEKITKKFDLQMDFLIRPPIIIQLVNKGKDLDFCATHSFVCTSHPFSCPHFQENKAVA